jgi:hypothetical protein
MTVYVIVRIKGRCVELVGVWRTSGEAVLRLCDEIKAAGRGVRFELFETLTA